MPGRDARRQLDELVVEERHADLERAGHRGAVEVGEHVVDEPEPGVEVERGLERRGSRARPASRLRSTASAAPACSASAPPNSSPRRSGRHEARSVASTRVTGSRRLQRLGEPAARGPGRGAARRPRRRAAGPAAGSSARRATRRDACGSRRTARRRPGRSARRSRARTRARTAAGSRATTGRRAARRGARSASSGRRGSCRGRPRARGGRRRARRPRGGRPAARSPRPRSRRRRSRPARSMCRAISATIRLESSPPLSIAPSGTSLISRSRTDSSSLSSSDLRPLLGRAGDGVGVGRRVVPPALDRGTAVGDHEALAGLELAHLAQRRHRAGHVAEHQVRGDRLGVELVARRGRWRART